jgi:hypothetical protein
MVVDGRGKSTNTGATAFADIFDAAQEGGQAVAGETIANLLPLFAAVDPTGLAHERQVFGDGGKIATDQYLQLADTAFSVGESLRDLQPRRMGQGLDDLNLVFDGDGSHCLAKMPSLVKMSSFNKKFADFAKRANIG